MYIAWPGVSRIRETYTEINFGSWTNRCSKVGHALYTHRCAPTDILPDARELEANRAHFPAALELRMELCGKQRKSTSKADALFLRLLTAWDNEALRDSDCSAPAHNNVYSAWPGGNSVEERCDKRDFGLRIWLWFKVGHPLYTDRCSSCLKHTN